MKRRVKLMLGAIIIVACINIFAMINTEGLRSIFSWHSSKKSYSHNQELYPSDRFTTMLTTMDIRRKERLRNDSIVFSSLSEAHKYMKSKKSIGDAKRIVIEYEDFQRHHPNFYNEEDRRLFMKSTIIQDSLKQNKLEQLRGIVEIVPNGTFQMEYSCGYPSDVEYFKVNRTSRTSKHYDILVPLIIPMAFLYQHFIDGTLPKLIQVLPYVLRPDVHILLEYPIHGVVYELLEQLGISSDQLVWHQRNDIQTIYTADFIIFACVAPPVHPQLWWLIREQLGVAQHLKQPFNASNVVLLTRTGASNNGRRIVNFEEVKQFLFKRYASRFFVFHSPPPLKENMKFFGSTGIIIGSHGGAFYNLYFAPTEAHIIEFAPILPGGRDIHALPHAIFWASADMIGQTYWRAPTLVANYANDMVIDLSKLKFMLDHIDR